MNEKVRKFDHVLIALEEFLDNLSSRELTLEEREDAKNQVEKAIQKHKKKKKK